MDDRIYYRVAPKSPAMAAIERIEAKDKAARDAANALRKALRLPEKIRLYGNHRIWGISSNPMKHAIDYVEKHSDAWRWDRRQRYGAPRKNTPEGKKIHALIEATPGSSTGHDLNFEILGLKNIYMSRTQHAILFASYARFHDEYVISLPATMVLDAKSKRPPKKQGPNSWTHDNSMPVIPEGLAEMKATEAAEFLERLHKAAEKEEEVEA